MLAKPPKLAEGTHIYDALAAAVAQVRGSALGAARIVLLSDGDDVGSATTLDSALAAARGAEDPRLHGRDPVAGLHAGRPREDRGRDGRRSPGPRRRLARVADEDLRRARLPARQRVPPPVPPSAAQPDENVDVEVAVEGRGARLVLLHDRRRRGRRRPFEPAFRDQLMQSWLLVPLIVRDRLSRVLRRRASSLEPPLQQGARRAARRTS